MRNPSHRPAWLSVEEYLVVEEFAETRHEYVAGVMHEMQRNTFRHNEITMNIAAKMLPLTKPPVEYHWRNSANEWLRTTLSANEHVVLGCPSVTLTFDDVYARVEFPTTTERLRVRENEGATYG